MGRNSRLLTSSAMLLISAGLSEVVQAQQASGQEIVVTARKREEALQDVPLAITAITGEELRRRSTENITDIQNQTPSLFFADGPGDQSAVLITIRGQGQPDNFLGTGASVGVYVDGVYYPRQLGLKSSLIDIERVEVLKGPQGTLYGKNTTGGAINITTSRPNLGGWGGFAEATLGNYDRIDFSAGINAPIIQDKLGLRLVGLTNNRDGFGRNMLGEDLKDDNTHFLRGHLLFEPNENFSLLLSGDWQRIREKGNIAKLAAVFPGAPAALVAGIESGNPAAGFDILSGFTRGSAYHTGGTAPSGSSYDGKGVSAITTWSPGEIEVKAILAYREFDRRSDHDYDASPFDILQGFTTTEDQFYSAELNVSGEAANDRLSWVVGAYYDHEDGNEASVTTALAAISPVNPQIIDGSSKAESWAVFGQGTFAVTDRLNITAGLRWSEETRSVEVRDRIIAPMAPPGSQEICNVPLGIREDPVVCRARDSKKFSDYTYLLSADYHVTPDVMIYAKTSRGFRSGGIKGVNTMADDFVTFDPETATDYEIGAKTQWLNRRLMLNVAAYQTKYKDIQRSVVIATPTGTFTTQIRNAAKATIKGFEAEVSASPTDRFTLSGTVSYTDATYDKFVDVTGDRSGEKFPVPKWTYSLSGQYWAPVANGELRLRADWSWRDKVVFEPTAMDLSSVSQGSFGLLNARLSYRHEETGVEIAVFGRNLLDKTYRASALALGPLGFNVALTGDPRTYGLQLRVPFGTER